MPNFIEIKKGNLIANAHAIAEAERKPDGSVILLYCSGATSTVLAGAETNKLWEMLQKASRTPLAIIEGQGLSATLDL